MHSDILKLPSSGTYLGRVWNPTSSGPSVVTIRNRRVVDLTSKDAPLSCDICEMEDPVGFIRSTVGSDLGDINEISANPVELDKYFNYYNFEVVQFPLNIFDRRIIDSGWLDKLKKKGVELHARSIFLQGLLLLDKKDLPKKFLKK